MKTFTIFLTVLIAMTITINAQIPNNGFENWVLGHSVYYPTHTSIDSVEIPDGNWITNNLIRKSNYIPVTKSTDHYPIGIGSFSIRMENNISLLGDTLFAGAFGYSTTAFFPGYNGPAFPISGHPTSLCGYYKFLPHNGDTLTIGITLYYNGVEVSSTVHNDTVTASSWTSFCISIPAYTQADSAQIGFSAFYGPLNGGFPTGPYGNSVLYIDNLSFDNLITSVSEQNFNNISFCLYPNPASDILTFNIDNENNADLTLNIYNVTGELISTEKLKQNKQQINIGNLNNGIYMIEIKSKKWTEKQKLIIQR